MPGLLSSNARSARSILQILNMHDLFRLSVSHIYTHTYIHTALYMARDKVRYEGACIRITDPRVRFDFANSKVAVYFRAQLTQQKPDYE